MSQRKFTQRRSLLIAGLALPLLPVAQAARAATAQITITVNKATLTVTADDKAMLAGGTVPALTVSYSGWANGETAATAAGFTPPAISTTATSSSTAGTYTITLSGGSADNYTLNLVSGVLTVGLYSIDANGVLTGVSSTVTGAVVIPNVINGIVVTQIGDVCFKNNTNITSVAIPSTVTEIGLSAFDGCTNLAAVTFDAGSQLAVISTYAFYDCTSLTGFTFPAAVTNVASQSFSGCSALQEVIFLGNRPTISSGDYAEAFRDCSSLNNIYYTAVNTAGWPGVGIEVRNSFDPRPITPELQP